LPSRFTGAALSTTAKGLSRLRAAAIVSRAESKVEEAEPAGTITRVAARIVSYTTTHMVGAVSMNTDSHLFSVVF
jgi:hypothetical protein